MLASRWLLSVRHASGGIRAWQVDSWGGDLRLNDNSPYPVMSSPKQLLVRVKAASINPIDTLTIKGYGDQMLSTWKCVEARDFSQTSRLPFIPGRDCAGVVEAVGPAVTRFKVGDKVMGVTQPPTARGTHAEVVALEESATVGIPKNSSFEEATSLPYVTCTVWSAFTIARLNRSNARDNRILIHGGSGGIGTLACQLLRAWGARKVVVTCSKDSFEPMRALGAIPVDYSSPTATDELINEGPYEVVLSCVDSPLSQWSDKIMGTWRNCVHVSIVSPMLKDTDRYGLPMGLASTAVKYFMRSAESAFRGKWFSYAYFMPSREALQEVASLVEEGKLRPIVEKVYPFSDVPAAYEKVSQKHGRGKTVISFEGERK